jgi:dUTP pyrophosphatase
MPHSVGIIDSDYRGEILVPLRNLGKEKVVIAKGERIAQLIILPYLKVKYVESKKLNETVRGKGGFGSTGKF